MKSISISIILGVLFCLVSCNPGLLDLSKSQNQQAINEANKLHQSTLIVRIPSQGNKIKFLKSALSNTTTKPEDQIKFRKLLQETEAENKEYYDLVSLGFDEKYSFSEVRYIPDSLYKAFKSGERIVFINEQNEVDPSISCNCEHYYFISQEKNKDLLVLTDGDGNRFQDPFPYKKNTFLPSFKRLFDRTKYVHNQIAWFNEKLDYLFIQYRK